MNILEKKHGAKIGFFAWLKIGLVVGMITITAAYVSAIFLAH